MAGRFCGDWHFLLLLPFLMSGIAGANETAGPRLVIFDDQLQGDFRDYSQMTRDLEHGALVRSGTRAIQLKPARGAGLYFYKSRAVLVRDYNTLEFWVHGGTSGEQQLTLALTAGGKPVATLPLHTLVPSGKLLAGTWQKASVDLARLALPNGVFDGILLQDTAQREQPPLYLDDMALRQEGPPPVQDQGPVSRPSAPAPKLNDLGLSHYRLLLAVNDTHALRLTAHLEDGSSADKTHEAVWSSSDPSVLSVERGALVARKTGVARISASFKHLTVSAVAQVTTTVRERVYDDALASGGASSVETGTPGGSPREFVRPRSWWRQGELNS